MLEFRADLHCHTTCSDGELSPQEILVLAKKEGLSGLSITDHDTVAAYAHLFPEAEKLGITLIPGVEFSTEVDETSIHVLGYAFDEKNEDLHAFIAQHSARREKRLQAILKALGKQGIALRADEVIKINQMEKVKNPVVGRPHIAGALLKKGYVKSYQEAFSLYIGEGKPCFIPGHGFTIEETIALIHKAGGLAIIAHPHLVPPKILPKLCNLHFDGIEAHYGNFSSSKNKRWVTMAKKKAWLVTGGSDFHGSVNKSNISLGCGFVPWEIFQVLLNHYKHVIRDRS